MTSLLGTRRAVASRGRGTFAVVDVEKEGSPWMVWFDGAGLPTWTVRGLMWPLDELERLAVGFGLTASESPGAMTPLEFSQRYPGAASWFQLNTAKAIIRGSAVLLVGSAIVISIVFPS